VGPDAHAEKKGTEQSMSGKKGLIVALVAAAVIGAAAIGTVVRAQTPGPGGSGAGGPSVPGSGPSAGDFRGRIDDFLNQLAQNLNIDRSTLNSALKTTAGQEIDKAVASGALSQDQANQIKQRIDNGQLPFGPGGFGAFGGGGRGGPGGNGGLPQAAAACGSAIRDAVPTALGISAADLRQARSNGETIAQIAQDHGKTLDDVRTAVQSSAQTCLDQQVQAGQLTQQQEQTILQRLQHSPFGRFGGRDGGRPVVQGPRDNQGGSRPGSAGNGQ
jgi:hypothetical protein